jgi:hypothetical protein
LSTHFHGTCDEGRIIIHTEHDHAGERVFLKFRQLSTQDVELIMQNRTHLGNRKHARVVIERPGFVILEPNGPWIECFIVDISEGGAQVRVGSISVPETFVLLLTAKGVRRLCRLIWRKGDLVGAKFISPKSSGDEPQALGCV